MAEERYIADLPIDRITIGKAQVRMKIDQEPLNDLAQSIRVQGQLEPIVVCEVDEGSGQYEVIAGQRRLLAIRLLGQPTIKALVRPKPADTFEAKAISLTENMLRTDPSRADTIDACTELFMKYGTIKAVSERTGLPQGKVREYVKVARLIPELQELVKSQGVEIQTALRAQDASAASSGEPNPEEAVLLARELSGMSGAQQSLLVKKRQQDPSLDVDELVESAKSGDRIIQIVVTMSGAGHASLKAFAKEEGTSMDDAARNLIESGLADRGFGGSEE
ncbi:ParB/RepB/Spo0J family partition protein [Kineococcus terrestris]|uniref:ParB/RepB/Spo0J family partition protein n=1 Tax=Kineococcus terrestris TaxID=2044856 RepID=UPI0034DADCE5